MCAVAVRHGRALHSRMKTLPVNETFTPGRISAIVPACNYARFLPETLDSVLAQDVPDLEVIVVDDASTDETTEVVAGYGDRVLYLRQPSRSGSGAAANRGALASTGEFLTFLDADDRWADGKLRRQMAELEDASVDAVFGLAQEFFSSELAEAERARVNLRRAPAPIAGTMMVRRSAYLRVGGFAERVTLGEFMDWYARAQDHQLTFRMLGDVFLFRRIHAANLTRRAPSARQDYARILKQSLDRRRASRAPGAEP
jgi:glycosyltransferase involved in cell wall biosynthesis